MNPNNCGTCDYKAMQNQKGDGWCYMFKNEPTYRCLVHTAPRANVIKIDRAAQGADRG